MHLFSKIGVSIRKPAIALMQKPTPVTYIGAGKVRNVAGLLNMYGAQRVLIITDEFLSMSGLLNGMLEEIKKAHTEIELFDGVTPDPTFETVMRAQEISACCDAVVAVGGGSVLDTAKAVSAAISNHTTASKLIGLFKVKRIPLPLIAIPTTAGTGSETTIAAVISDSQTHFKKQILDPKIVPIAAILDPELTVGLPPHTTAFTAMDALTHALEAYVSDYATEETNRFAKIAIKLIYRNLPIVHQSPNDLEARESLLVASLFAGMAFTRAYIGYVHAFAHTVGSKFGVPHGLANAVLLPHIMQLYRPLCNKQFASLANLVGLGDVKESEELRAQKFVDSIFAMNQECGVPTCFEKLHESDIDEIIRLAFKEAHGVYPVPRYLSKQEVESVLKKVCSNWLCKVKMKN